MYLKVGIDYSRLPRAPCSTAANQTFAARAIFRYQLLLERGSLARRVIQLFARAIPFSCGPISTMDVSRARAAAAFIVIHQIIKKKPKRKPRWWMKKLYLNRMQYGVKLMEDMRHEAIEDTIKNFTRMTTIEFEHLKSLIEAQVKKIDTQFREAISVTERLAITLRFLATGDSYTSLQYLFRVSKQSISRIVPEVCDALCVALKDWVKAPNSETEWLELAHDFETKWNFPHAIEKHPEIKKLYGPDKNFKWIVVITTILQLGSLYLIRDLKWPTVMILAYCFGGVVNHSLMLAIHEIAHNMGFGPKYPMYNKLLGMFANLPIGLPFSVTFKHYHLEHHRYQGDEKLDTDIPTYVEAKLFSSTFGKFIWVLLQPFFYALRPMFVYPKNPTALEIISVAIQLAFNYWVYLYFGTKVITYMLAGSLMAMGLHPVAGHFISEHYMFHKGFETYSYYGPLNFITFNVGYHNEHHDFPFVPGSKLPQVKKIAPEFYDNLPQHHSWTSVLYDFIMDPNIGPYARIKRKHKGLKC